MRKGLFDLVRGLAESAREAATREAAAYALGRVAGKDLRTDHGEVIVEAGHKIDERAIEMAIADGKIAALAGVAVTAQAQDARERAESFIAGTDEGVEARSLDTVEAYVEARRHIGKRIGVDVTDLRGNVVIAAGTQLDEGHLRTARSAGLLDALMYAATQPWTQPQDATAAPEQSPAPAPAAPKSEAPPATPRRLPLVTPPEPPGRGDS